MVLCALIIFLVLTPLRENSPIVVIVLAMEFVCVGCAEESSCRGVLTRVFRDRCGMVWAAVIVSVLFSLSPWTMKAQRDTVLHFLLSVVALYFSRHPNDFHHFRVYISDRVHLRLGMVDSDDARLYWGLSGTNSTTIVAPAGMPSAAGPPPKPPCNTKFLVHC